MTGAWRRVLATLIALAPFLVLAAAEWPLQPDLWYSDFAQYVAHARALADGRPYADTGYIFTPRAYAWAPAAYPPGLPLALSPVVWAFEGSIAAVKAWMIVLSVATLVVIGAYFWRRVGPFAGLALMGLVGLSPQWVSLSVAPLTDVVFAGVVWATLSTADQRRAWGRGRVAAVTVLLATAVAVRPHGLTLLPALAVWGLIHRKEVGGRVFLPVAAVAAGLVLAWLMLPVGSMRGINPHRMVVELVTGPPRYHFAVFDSHLYPFPWNLANDGYHLVTSGLMLLGLWFFARRHGLTLSLVFGAVYGLALASMVPSDPRYAFPLYPLFVFGLVNGLCHVARRWVPHRAGPLTLGFAALLAIVSVVRGLTRATEPRALDDPDYRALVAWVEENRARDGTPLRVAVFRPRVLAWETGASAMPLLTFWATESHVEEWCTRRITHVIVGAVGEGMGGRMRRTRAALESRPGAFEVVYDNEAFTVHRVRRDVLCPPFREPDTGSPTTRSSDSTRP